MSNIFQYKMKKITKIKTKNNTVTPKVKTKLNNKYNTTKKVYNTHF